MVMRRVLISLSALIVAASLVTLANATMTTVMPLRLLQDGASDVAVALFGAAFFAGFAVGCFSEPPRIFRVGYIRAFAAAAAVCTTLAIVMDMTASPALWIALRFVMGVSLATIFASVDGWINETTPDDMRATVYSVYGWCIGASAVLGQLMLVAWDGLAAGFITVLALAFNVAVTLITLTRASVPQSRPVQVSQEQAPRRRTLLAVTSWTAAAAAIYTGLVVTAILATLPAILSQAGASDSTIGIVIGSYFVGRLILQIPLGVIADRMDLRVLIAAIAVLTAAVAAIAWVLIVLQVARFVDDASAINRLIGIGVAVLLGGITLPVYTLAVALGFVRQNGLPPVRIATTLLLLNSAGAVAGPMMVAVLLPLLGWVALVWVIVGASVVMAAVALWSHRTGESYVASATPIIEIPDTSVAMAESVGEVQARAQAEARASAAEPEPAHP